jgi:hypothetical protein
VQQTVRLHTHYLQVPLNADRVIVPQQGECSVKEKFRGLVERGILPGNPNEGRVHILQLNRFSWGDCRDQGNDHNKNNWYHLYTPKDYPRLCSWMKQYLNYRNSRPCHRSHPPALHHRRRYCSYMHRAHSYNCSIHRRCIPLSMLK